MSQGTLNDVLNAIHTKQFIVANSEKNRETRFRLGLTVDDLKNIILSLTSIDYVSGPEDDYDGSDGEIWKFKKQAFGETFYIKLKIKEPLIAISCHIDNIQI
ncbi:MAG: type II toxin-antitoxin system MqsR family toxin [Clostridia bacterium]|nr:type II toxin-antitoxin system MqsR family toxin [Clostridia bacterium]